VLERVETEQTANKEKREKETETDVVLVVVVGLGALVIGGLGAFLYFFVF
jgi:hypothetical protein